MRQDQSTESKTSSLWSHGVHPSSIQALFSVQAEARPGFRPVLELPAGHAGLLITTLAIKQVSSYMVQLLL